MDGADGDQDGDPDHDEGDEDEDRLARGPLYKRARLLSLEVLGWHGPS